MHYVLGGLVSMGVVTQAQADAVDPLVGGGSPSAAQQAQQQHNQQAIEADLQNGQPSNTVGPAPHFVEYVESELEQDFANDPAYLDGSLTVTTTLDLGLQEKADQDVANGVAKLGHGANNGALLMLDPSDGDILAYVGSANFSDNSIAGQYDIVRANRQPGSSFKPLVYETGFKNGTLTPDTILQDTRAESQQLGGVQDFDREYEGPITATQALLGSRNIATEQAMEIAGIQNVIDFATSAGITTPIAPNASSAIGTSATSMMDLATAYTAFANGGTKVMPRAILKVVDASGNVLVDNSQPAGGTRIMTPAQAWSITNILRRYPNFWDLGIKWTTAGKSGTTDNFVDAWYTAYTPSWVISTWAGHTSGTSQAEVGMNEVFGTTEAEYIAVPFINSLSKPAAFTPANGQVAQCTGATPANITQGACGSPSPSASPSESATPSATSSATPTASPTPSCATSEPLQTLGPCATATPSASPTGSGAQGANSGPAPTPP
jgi:membrane peptidoglycan carboxypeptidase